MKNYISSTSVDNTEGSARIIIEGRIPSPRQCDDPVVEIFRAIRAKHKDNVLFSVIVARKDDCVICSIYPSNNDSLPTGTFVKRATDILPRVVCEYEKALIAFFEDESGLDLYRKNTEGELWAKANEDIKLFVKKMGLEMPSRKKMLEALRKAQEKKPAN